MQITTIGPDIAKQVFHIQALHRLRSGVIKQRIALSHQIRSLLGDYVPRHYRRGAFPASWKMRRMGSAMASVSCCVKATNSFVSWINTLRGMTAG